MTRKMEVEAGTESEMIDSTDFDEELGQATKLVWAFDKER